MKIIALATLLLASLAVAGSAPQPVPPVELVQLPLKFPAVGNIAGVKQWRFGRLQDVEVTSGTDDIVLRIRINDGSVARIIAPRRPLVELARQCGWMRFDSKTIPTRPDYVERMIAFDVDSNGRLIAMMSLDPVPRDTKRLRRALGG
ncbi:MAG: hypothetical protein ACYTF9_01005 [Planctomycetota bacterium]|jgi:hypothetical protein